MSNRNIKILYRRDVGPLKYAVILIGAFALNFAVWSSVIAQVNNPGVQQSGSVTSGHCAQWGPGLGQISDAGEGCAGGTVPTPANPTATAGPTANNGVATSYMRSDASPAVQQGSATQKGIVQVDGTSITASGGVISATAANPPTPANPTATAGPTAVNGVATTFMRSDAAPAVQAGSASQEGILQCGSNTTCTAGTISVAAPVTAANPTATAGPAAVNGTATTWMRSDAAPAVRGGNNSQVGLLGCDATGVTCPSSTISIISATKAQQQAGSASNVAVTPSIQQQHPSAAKAWVQFGGCSTSSCTIGASYNVTSVTRNSVGNYTLTFTVAFATSTYACSGNAGSSSSAGVLFPAFTAAPTTTTFQFDTATVVSPNSATDFTNVSVICFGSQ